MSRRAVAFLSSFGIVSVIAFGLGARYAGQEIEASRFILRDDAGTIRATLGFLENGNPAIVFYDAQGKEISVYPPVSRLTPKAVVRPTPKKAVAQRPGVRRILSEGATTKFLSDVIVAVDVNNLSPDDLIRAVPGSGLEQPSYVSRRDPNYDKVEEARNASDTEGLQEMVTQGLAVQVTSGTSLRIVGSSNDFHTNGLKYRVRILDGPAQGKACWVPERYVNTTN